MNGLRHSAAIAMAAALALGACQPETSGPDSGVTVREIQQGRQGSPENKYAGETVTVSADVNRVIGKHAFSIAGTRSGVEPLLVVHDSNVTLDEDSPIKVTGVVRTKFNVADVEKQVRFEFDRDVFSDYRNAPYIQGNSIKPSP